MTTRTTVGDVDGVWADAWPDGSLAWLSWRTTRLGMYAANSLETPLATPWLRRHDAATGAVLAAHPVLGPASGSRVSLDPDHLVVSGEWDGLGYRAELVLGERTWAWVIEVEAAQEVTFDVVAVQDVSLAPPWLVRMNELYGAQYLDVTTLAHPRAGTAVAVRQNQLFEGTNPWLVLTCTDEVVGYATDLLDLAGTSLRTGRTPAGLLSPSLTSRRLQHEHTLVALKTGVRTLAAGEAHRLAVVGLVVPDHPEATGESDLAHVEDALEVADALVAAGATHGAPRGRHAAPGHAEEAGAAHAVVPTLFTDAPLLAVADAEEAPAEATFVERDSHGALAWFLGPTHHVVTRRKELEVLRPHGHVMRTGGVWLPEESVLTTTVTMGGLFASYLTQGNVSRDKLISLGRGYLGHHRAAGVRAFVRTGEGWALLDTPTTWSIESGRVQWRYVTQTRTIVVTTTAATDSQHITLDVTIEGEAAELLLATHLGMDGDDGLDAFAFERTDTGPVTEIRPVAGSALAQRRPGGALVIERTGAAAAAELSDDSALFADGRTRGLPWLTVATPATNHAGLVLGATLVAAAEGGDATFWEDAASEISLEVPANASAAPLARLAHVLPWYLDNALTHYLSPRGIEQYTGGGWGTRDVSQGPVELLLALDRPKELRALLLRLLASQGSDGGWGQAFEIFPVDRTSPNGDAHGDVIFWPVLAVGRYLCATGDATILRESVPFYAGSEDAGEASVAEHLARAVARAGELVLPGTHLTAYGHGDWNDSLQPADPTLKDGMTSSWTVTLHHQALTTLAEGLEASGGDHGPLTVDALRAQAATILAEFQQVLLPDGVVAGYAVASPEGYRYLLHPRDESTGLTYSVLPMIHAVAEQMFTPEQALAHERILAEHLVLPDGAHLFDKPPVYRGGPMHIFQRAESASYFGREIGTMYTHAHLRYAECMARLGDGEKLVRALDLANPVDTRSVFAGARRRQATAYFSSSDAVVPDRYTATKVWDQVRHGEIEVEGGWRVYSSGPGIALRIVVECLLGVVRRAEGLLLDPVLTPDLDGLGVTLNLWGRRVRVVYAVGERGHGPERVCVYDTELPAVRQDNRYRKGGLLVAREELMSRLRDGSEIRIEIP